MEFELEDDNQEDVKQSSLCGVSEISENAYKQNLSGRKKSSVEFSALIGRSVYLWKRIRYIAKGLVWLGVALYIYGTFYAERFDEKIAIPNSLRKPPYQNLIDEEAFDFEYHGKSYLVKPLAEYEISGLIVTHNNISGIGDVYHTGESVDFRDICMVWGTNVTTGAFRNMEFWSGPWTCWVRAKDPQADRRFNPNELSNTHLLSGIKSVRDTINNLHIGDQLRLRGKLIKYWPKELPERYARTSSLVRTDTGNGACEVMWVESVEVLNRGSGWWHKSSNLGKVLMGLGLVLALSAFIAAPVRTYLPN
jgi:hypothetical protein